jgi:hypothetical protein
MKIRNLDPLLPFPNVRRWRITKNVEMVAMQALFWLGSFVTGLSGQPTAWDSLVLHIPQSEMSLRTGPEINFL